MPETVGANYSKVLSVTTDARKPTIAWDGSTKAWYAIVAHYNGRQAGNVAFALL